MALTDVQFTEGEAQDFILERAIGTLNAPLDIAIETSSDGYYVNDIPDINTGGGGNVFIMQD